MSKAPKPCTWGGPAAGWFSPEHLRDCSSPDCRGCRPCGEHHCAMRGQCPNHVDADAGIATCPGCIARTRHDIEKIMDLYALADVAVERRGRGDLDDLLTGEAEQDGVDSEALNLLGPAASPEQWHERRRRLMGTYESRGWCEWPRAELMADDDPHHPYIVLGRWDLALREEYGPQSDLFITVTSAAGFLIGLLAGTFPHTRQFEELAGEMARCRAHLEAAVHDSRTPELGRPCPQCAEEREDGKGPRLQRRYAAHPGLPPGERCAAAPGKCKICDSDKADTWHCPDVPAHWWTEYDYRNRVHADYLDHASTLPAPELADQIGVPLSTVRKWCAREWDARAERWIPPRLVSTRRALDGRKAYRVDDALRLAEEWGA